MMGLKKLPRQGKTFPSSVERVFQWQLLIVATTLVIATIVTLRYAEENRREEILAREEVTRQIAAASLTAELRYFEIASLQLSVQELTHLSGIQKVKVLDRFNFPQAVANSAEVSPERPPDVIEEIDENGTYLGELHIWYDPDRTTINIGLDGSITPFVAAMFVLLAIMTASLFIVVRRFVKYPFDMLLAELSAAATMPKHQISSPASMTTHEAAEIWRSFLTIRDGWHSALKSADEHFARETEAYQTLHTVLIEFDMLIFIPETGRIIGCDLPPGIDLNAASIPSGEPNSDPDTAKEMKHFDLKSKDDRIWQGSLVAFEGNKSAILLKDVTEERAIEARLRRKRILETTGALTSGVAHDLNNALAIITFSLEELKQDDGSNWDATHEALNRAIERASGLVSRLRSLSTDAPQDTEQFSVSNLVGELSKLLPPMLGPKIALHIDCNQDAYVQSDRAMLESCIVNLVVNARDALEDGGDIRVSLSLTTADASTYPELNAGKKYVCIQVEDNGKGIEKEIAEKIFDPFFTTKNRKSGTGLGLSSVRNFVYSSGGAISFSTSPGNGTRFSLLIPEVESQAAAQATTKSHEESLAGMRILLVEDEEYLARSIKLGLEKSNSKVVVYNDAQSALSHLENDITFDVVISDFFLGDGNGLDIFNKVRAHSPDVSFILISGNTESAPNEILQDKNVVILPKPFRLKRIVETVSMVRKSSPHRPADRPVALAAQGLGQ